MSDRRQGALKSGLTPARWIVSCLEGRPSHLPSSMDSRWLSRTVPLRERLRRETRTEFTLDDLEQIPDDAIHRELVNGKLIELPPRDIAQAVISGNIYWSLTPWVESRCLGKVFLEIGFKVTVSGRNWIQPDLSFINRDKWKREADKKYLSGAPDLAVEVTSPSEQPKHVFAKRKLLFREGCREIWIVRPETHRIEVWTPRWQDRELCEGDTLSSPLFDGWSMPIAEVFDRFA